MSLYISVTILKYNTKNVVVYLKINVDIEVKRVKHHKSKYSFLYPHKPYLVW